MVTDVKRTTSDTQAPVKIAPLKNVHGERVQTMKELGQALLRVSQNRVSEGIKNNWSNWTVAGKGWNILAQFCMFFQRLHHAFWDAVGKSTATNNRDTVLKALQTAAKAQANNPNFRVSDLKENYQITSEISANNTESPVAAAMALSAGINPGHKNVLVGGPDNDGAIKILANAFSLIGRGDMEFIGAVLESLRPTDADGIALDIKDLGGNTVVMDHRAYSTFKKSVFEETALDALGVEFTGAKSVTREEVENAALRYATNVIGYQDMVGLRTDLSDEEVRIEIRRLGLVDQFITIFNANAVTGEPGAGVEIYNDVQAKHTAYTTALDHAPIVRDFTVAVTKAKDNWTEAKAQYDEAVKKLSQLLKARDEEVRAEIGKGMPFETESDVKLSPGYASPKRALFTVANASDETKKREQEIASLLTKINELKTQCQNAHYQVDITAAQMKKAAIAQANEARKQFNSIKAAANAVMAHNKPVTFIDDNGVEKTLRSVNDVLVHWGITFEYMDGEAFSVEKAAAAILQNAQATKEYKAGMDAGYKAAMLAFVMDRELAHLIPKGEEAGHLRTLPLAGVEFEKRLAKAEKAVADEQQAVRQAFEEQRAKNKREFESLEAEMILADLVYEAELDNAPRLPGRSAREVLQPNLRDLLRQQKPILPQPLYTVTGEAARILRESMANGKSEGAIVPRNNEPRIVSQEGAAQDIDRQRFVKVGKIEVLTDHLEDQPTRLALKDKRPVRQSRLAGVRRLRRQG